MTHDLSFVDPERRPEVLRRIEAIERFLADPGAAKATTIAGELGLSAAQFYRLVRAWRGARRPQDLAQAVRRRDRRPPSLDEREAETVRNLEASLADASVERVVAALHAMAEREGLRQRGLSTLRRIVSATRRERLATTPLGAGLAVDHCAVDIAVWSADGEATMAIAAIVVDLRRRTPIGISLDARGPSPRSAAEAILHAMRSPIPRNAAWDGASIPLALETDQNPAWHELETALEAAGLAVATKVASRIGSGGVVTAIAGDELLGVRLHPRLTRVPPESRRPAGTGRGRRVAGAPVDVALAQRVMQTRLEAEGHRPSALDGLDEGLGDRLRRRLDVIARAGA